MAIKIELPRPIVRDRQGVSVSKYTVRDWYEKISEEVLEAHSCAVSGYSGAEIMELVDVVTACVSRLNQLGVKEEKLPDFFAAVNQKNEERGYFNDN